mgnify:CR=1 FL=1|jgi:hypothetical protein
MFVGEMFCRALIEISTKTGSVDNNQLQTKLFSYGGWNGIFVQHH